MSPKDLYYFTGRCLTLDEHPGDRDKILQAIGQPGFPWEKFVQMGSSHLVLPALYIKFRNANLLPCLPDELTEHLAHIHRLNVERNEGLSRQIRWLIDLFQRNGIHPVLLKGAGVLVDQLYSDPGERILADIDCMVREDDFEKAVAILRSNGYNAPPFHPASLPMMHHFPSLFKPGEPAPIEVHHIPVGRRQLKYINLERIRSYLYDTSGIKPITLKGQDQLMVNVIHSQLKDRGQFYANISLRNIYEFYRLSRKYGSPGIEVRSCRMGLILNNYLTVASRLFEPEQQEPVRKQFRSRLYLMRFEFGKTNRIYSRTSKFIRSLADLLYTYLRICYNVFAGKEHRMYLWIRLSNPSWYLHHLEVLRKRFTV
jgi:hypothetical protein